MSSKLTCRTPTLVRSRRGQMKQIVWNLATNGLRAMPQGGPSVPGRGFDPAIRRRVLERPRRGRRMRPEDVDGPSSRSTEALPRECLGLAIVTHVTDYKRRDSRQFAAGRARPCSYGCRRGGSHRMTHRPQHRARARRRLPNFWSSTMNVRCGVARDRPTPGGVRGAARREWPRRDRAARA